MNKRQLKALLAVNLRLLNPQSTDRYRKKGFNGVKLTRKLSFTFVFSGIVFLLLYGMTMLRLDFSKMPGMFTSYAGIFILIGFSQGISGIYNIFFAEKDLASYLPLPFRQNIIFLSKILIVSLNVLPFTIPLFLILLLTSWHSHLNIVLAIILSVIIYFVISAIILAVGSVMVFLLAKTSLFRKYQNLVMNSLIFITAVIAFGGYILISGNSNQSQPTDLPVIGVLMPLFSMMNNPLSMKSGLGWMAIVAILIIFGVLLQYLVSPHLGDQLTQVNTIFSSTKKRKYAHHQGINRNLLGYNFQLLKEPNLLVQVLANSLIAPIIFIIMFATANSLTKLPSKWAGVFFVVGIAISGLTISQSSLISNLILLD